MKILFIPLDERPCNYLYPQLIAETSSIDLVIPGKNFLSSKKIPANTTDLWQFLFDNASSADVLVLSVDMMLYGGLIPSRLHQLDQNLFANFDHNLRLLKRTHPSLEIYGFNCIMRCPSYSSSDEEPDYYEDYGRQIFRRKYLQDKHAKNSLIELEKKELNELLDSIPSTVLSDFESRREFNLNANFQTVQLLREGLIRFLVFPQDDSSPYGYTAIDQQRLIDCIGNDLNFNNIAVYPGADEVGLTLMARAYNEYHQRRPTVYSFYSSKLGPNIIPLYEDRELNRSVEAHILAAGGVCEADSSKADYILAINTPAQLMYEASAQRVDQYSHDLDHSLSDFVRQIKDHIDSGRAVILADCAFANGGHLELIKLLDEQNVLGSLLSYKGWNTTCNTLGSSLAAGMIATAPRSKILRNLIYHLLDDGCYQALVRQQLINYYFPNSQLGHTMYRPDQIEPAMLLAKQLLVEAYQSLISISLPQDIDFTVDSPWQRTFEIGLVL